MPHYRLHYDDSVPTSFVECDQINGSPVVFSGEPIVGPNNVVTRRALLSDGTVLELRYQPVLFKVVQAAGQTPPNTYDTPEPDVTIIEEEDDPLLDLPDEDDS